MSNRRSALIVFILLFFGTSSAFTQTSQFDINQRPYYIWDYAFGKDSLENLYVIWGDSRNTRNNEGNEFGASIYLQKFDKHMNPIGNNQRVTEEKITTSTYPGDILVLDDGRYFITYIDYEHITLSDGTSDIVRSVWITGFLTDGTIWHEKQRVDNPNANNDGRVFRPKITKLSDKSFAIYWQDYRENGQKYSYSQKYTLNMEKVGNDIRINPDEVESNTVFIHYIEENRLLVQYLNNLVQYVDSSFNELGNLLPLDERGIVTPLGSDSLFQSYTNENSSEIYFKFLNADMSERSTPIRVNDDGTINPKRPPKIIQNPQGGFLLVWEDYRNGFPGVQRYSVSDIYGQLYDENNAPIGSNKKLNQEPRELHQGKLKTFLVNSQPIYFWV